MINIELIIPQLFLFGWAILILIIDFFKKSNSREVLGYIALLGLAFTAFLTVISKSGEAFYGTYISDDYGRLFNIIFILSAMLTIIASINFAEIRMKQKGEYYSLLLFATVGMMFLSGAVELVTLGDVQPEDMPLYMNACDVMILTSDSEGSPNVVKEAMACNLPVVSVDAGDAWQVMGEAAHCYRAERSPADLADKLRRVLSESSRSDGRRHIGHLELGAVARQVVAVYMSAVKGPRFE